MTYDAIKSELSGHSVTKMLDHNTTKEMQRSAAEKVDRFLVAESEKDVKKVRKGFFAI